MKNLIVKIKMFLIALLIIPGYGLATNYDLKIINHKDKNANVIVRSHCCGFLGMFNATCANVKVEKMRNNKPTIKKTHYFSLSNVSCKESLTIKLENQKGKYSTYQTFSHIGKMKNEKTRAITVSVK